MFTGIVESTGTLANLTKEAGNVHLEIKADFVPELKIDQSVSHNGACLTVVNISEHSYVVTVIEESLQRTNISNLKVGDSINLERCMKLGDRLDGHMVQGHVDQTAKCESIINENGSWKFFFSYDDTLGNITVEKGSICVNGVSLTVVDSSQGKFSVAIIPYTYEHTNFRDIKVGDIVNLEFDILGKYISQLMKKA